MPERVDLVPTDLDGVVLIPLIRHPDERGFVAEHFRRSWVPGMREVVQGNLSRSGPRVLRGLHFHRRQADYWTVLEGTALVGLFDLRSGSPTEGRGATAGLAADSDRTLYIPRGVAHGFYTDGGLLLQYLVDEPYSGEDEFGVAWDDPALGIDWPDRDPVLSERDRSNPSLADLEGARPPYP
jgi:dTDP-4-dehydrorhamnose 3,5-epimerase